MNGEDVNLQMQSQRYGVPQPTQPQEDETPLSLIYPFADTPPLHRIGT